MVNCQKNNGNSGSDKLETFGERRSNDLSANAWLVQQGIRYLHRDDKEGELAYKHVVDLLSRNGGANSIVQIIRTAPREDVPIRWSLLYLLGDIEDKDKDKKAAQWLSEFSVEQLPAKGEGCEGPRDTELLLRTMAIESLKKIATRDQEVSEYFLKIIAAKPDKAILIEAVKSAVELGLKDKVAELLPKEDHWIFDIRKARAEEMHADPERADTNERSFTPPKMISDYTTPSIKCGCRKGGSHHG